MRKILLMLAIVCTLSACVHKMDIEQGNIITEEQVNKLHPGMSKDAVKEMMGTPVLMNTFADNRIDYVYTYQPGHGERTEKYITLNFKNGRLVKISGNMYSQFINK
ncbi:MAG: SmpA / OmlA family protein [uncultured bacterium]|nr:MAG: SmpA / OmlA family protein [uncultured bacterium]